MEAAKQFFAANNDLLREFLRDFGLALKNPVNLILFAVVYFLWELIKIIKKQESLLYVPLVPGFKGPGLAHNPGHLNHEAPRMWGLRADDFSVKTEDQITIKGWFIRCSFRYDSKTAPTIVFAHANAGNYGLRLPNYHLLSALGANVVAFSYRGYADNEGKPSEAGLEKDVDAVVRWLLTRGDQVDLRKVFFFGRSLGGAVAIRAAVNHPDVPAGVILENTFTSIPDIVDAVFPVLGKLKFFLRMNWPSATILPAVKKPMLFLASGADEIVPVSMMRKLHHIAENNSGHFVEWMETPDAKHNDLTARAGERYSTTVSAFINRVLTAKLGAEAARTRELSAAEREAAMVEARVTDESVKAGYVLRQGMANMQLGLPMNAPPPQEQEGEVEESGEQTALTDDGESKADDGLRRRAPKATE